MSTYSQKTVAYLDRTWRLDSRPQFDLITLLWENRRYALVCKALVSKGMVNPDSDEAKEVIAIAESTPDAEMKATVTNLARKYTFVRCKTCNAEFYYPASVGVWELLQGPCYECKDTQCLAKATHESE